MILRMIGKVVFWFENFKRVCEDNNEFRKLRNKVIKEIIDGYKEGKKSITVGAAIKNVNTTKKTLIAVVEWLKKKSFVAEYNYYPHSFENTIHIDLNLKVVEQDVEVDNYLDALPADERIKHCGTCGGRMD